MNSLPAPSSISGEPQSLPKLLYCHRRTNDDNIVEIHTTLISDILARLYDNLRMPANVSVVTNFNKIKYIIEGTNSNGLRSCNGSYEFYEQIIQRGD